MIKKVFQNDQIKKFSIYGFGQFFNLVSPLIVIPYVVSICGEENFGKAAVGMAMAFFLYVFVDYGSEIVGSREVAINRNNLKRLENILIVNLVSRLLLLLLVLSISILLIYVVFGLRNEKELFLGSLLIVVGQYFNLSWFFQGLEKVTWITFGNVFSKIIYLSSVFFLIDEKSDYIYINFLFGFGAFVTNLSILFIVFKKYNFRWFWPRFEFIRRFYVKDFSILISQIFVALQNNMPVILISHLGGNLLAGQYRIIDQLILIFKTYLNLFFNYIYPRICYLIDSFSDKLLKEWRIFNGLNIVFVILGSLILYWKATFFVSFFNVTFVEEMVQYLRIAVFIPVIVSFSIALKQMLLSYNLKKEYVTITTISITLNLLSIILVLPIYGITGVLYVHIVTELFIVLFYLLCTKNFLRKEGVK